MTLVGKGLRIRFWLGGRGRKEGQREWGLSFDKGHVWCPNILDIYCFNCLLFINMSSYFVHLHSLFYILTFGVQTYMSSGQVEVN